MSKLHPNPQFERDDFVSLNGLWDFQIFSLENNDEVKKVIYDGKIKVPFCPESPLSGVEYTDFITHCSYAKKINLSARQLEKNVILHFGACDYETSLYVNGKYVAKHEGGYSSFGFDITSYAQAGENEIYIKVFDDITANVGSGKQCYKLKSFGCFYTRVTGIWQDVWLEFISKNHIENFKFYCDINKPSVVIVPSVFGKGDFLAEVFLKGEKVGQAQKFINQNDKIECALCKKSLWEIGEGNLYDVKLSFCGDVVYTYFGLRECHFDGFKFMLNGKSVFQRLVLDQGYNQQGLYTSPTVEFIQNDIALAKSLGFNGARLHQKIFEPKYLYECDKAGYIVWSEYPSWGLNNSNLECVGSFMGEWREIIERDFNHPCIVAWCPANEFWQSEFSSDETLRICDVRLVKTVCDFTKTLDTTRPCVDASGGYHSDSTDVYDFHIYTSVEETKKYIDELNETGVINIANLYPPRESMLPIRYNSQAIMASEYGGMSYSDRASGWGYGEKIDSAQKFADMICDLTKLHFNSEYLSGVCYTQLYDIEQEQNGLFYYDRAPKLDLKQRQQIKETFTKKAKLED